MESALRFEAVVAVEFVMVLVVSTVFIFENELK